MKTVLEKIAELCDLDHKEAAVWLLLSALGWGYFAYSYLFETGLGVAVPRYAGF